MKGKLLFMVGLFLLAIPKLKGEGKDSIPHFSVGQKTVYSFIIQDSPARLFTMRQFDEDYLSGYRLYTKMMGDLFSPRLNLLVLFAQQLIGCQHQKHEIRRSAAQHIFCLLPKEREVF